MTPEELEHLDPSTLTAAQRGALRAKAMTAANPDTRALAARILRKGEAQQNPSEAYRRGAARAAATDTTRPR
jgi:hypothetical protein